ncbi:MAG: hypothetical protein OES79_16195 [Planctomycetota bacterium]|nr:hypothetical protein [Planctomycetota bacterium]
MPSTTRFTGLGNVTQSVFFVGFPGRTCLACAGPATLMLIFVNRAMPGCHIVGASYV